MNASKVLALVACIIFVLAAFGVIVGSVGMIPIGLAFLAASLVV